ncbi:IS3 family transposase [Saccharothrix sp. S26]|uniref:IS3 family transposase n=1 Tax=Saccharothrix sp. S26 TaxID=2907215 RepID=UPI001F47530F|nr:IS3 family transposase [Saccharothrix sp. S26]MCE6995379.1 IS3 family transposase [Saccharothrix sp. S26]
MASSASVWRPNASSTSGVLPQLRLAKVVLRQRGSGTFFATLKTEIGTTVWDTRDAARRGVFAYLGYYNHDRLHSTVDYRAPYEVRVGCRQDSRFVA